MKCKKGIFVTWSSNIMSQTKISAFPLWHRIVRMQMIMKDLLNSYSKIVYILFYMRKVTDDSYVVKNHKIEGEKLGVKKTILVYFWRSVRLHNFDYFCFPFRYRTSICSRECLSEFSNVLQSIYLISSKEKNSLLETFFFTCSPPSLEKHVL